MSVQPKSMPSCRQPIRSVLIRASTSIVSRILGEETYRRSQGSLVAAHESFSELVERFPATRYATDASFRIRFIVNEIARIKLEAVRNYMRRGAYGAASRRSSYLLSSYPDSTSGEEALALMAPPAWMKWAQTRQPTMP